MTHQLELREIEELLAHGRVPAAAELLKDFIKGRSPNLDDRLPIAALARRCGLFELGLQILTPLIYQEGKARSARPPTVRERAEYFALLIKVGVVNEAQRGLLELKAAQSVDYDPEVDLYLAFSHLLVWDFAAAATQLRQVLQKASDSRVALIARTNLASALIQLRQYEEALDILQEAQSRANQLGSKRLFANCEEMRAQIFFHRREFVQCRESLEIGLKILDHGESNDSILLKKWDLLLSAVQSKNPGSSIAELESLARVAQQRGHWEASRDIERHILKIEFTERRFRRLMFGTPYASFRALVSVELGASIKDETYEWQAEDEGLAGPGQTLDLSQAEEIHGIGGIDRDLFVALTSDFYRPRKLMELFSWIYPEERFNVFSSPGRVRKALSRGRTRLAAVASELSISTDDAGYTLKPNEKVGIKLPYWRHTGLQKDLFVLVERFRRQEFTVVEAVAALNWSRKHATQVLQIACDRGLVTRMFQGPATRYRV